MNFVMTQAIFSTLEHEIPLVLVRKPCCQEPVIFLSDSKLSTYGNSLTIASPKAQYKTKIEFYPDRVSFSFHAAA